MSFFKRMRIVLESRSVVAGAGVTEVCDCAGTWQGTRGEVELRGLLIMVLLRQLYTCSNA